MVEPMATMEDYKKKKKKDSSGAVIVELVMGSAGEGRS